VLFTAPNGMRQIINKDVYLTITYTYKQGKSDQSKCITNIYYQQPKNITCIKCIFFKSL